MVYKIVMNYVIHHILKEARGDVCCHFPLLNICIHLFACNLRFSKKGTPYSKKAL